MAENNAEQVVDVRAIAPRLRHPTIFNRWQDLANGGALLLVNDHDPLPLYFQFACEQAGRFRWDYLEEGPETWRVRITKGECLDPGFVPKRAAKGVPRIADATFVEPLVLDTRPIFHRGDSPCGEIDEAVAQLIPGQPLVLLVPFQPAPLYSKLAAQGFTHQAQMQDDGTWRVEFRKT